MLIGEEEAYAGFVYTRMNSLLREVPKLEKLSPAAIKDAEQEALGGLFHYARLLLASLKMLTSAGSTKMALARGSRLSLKALAQISTLEGRVIAFQSYTSFSTQTTKAAGFPVGPPKAGTVNVTYQLHCVGRPKIGGWAVTQFQGEDEVLIPPFTPLLVENVTWMDGRTCIVLRDLRPEDMASATTQPEEVKPEAVKPSPSGDAKVHFNVELEGETIQLELRTGATVAEAIKLAKDEFERDDITALWKDGVRIAKSASIGEGSYEAKTSVKATKPAPVVAASTLVKVTIEVDGESIRFELPAGTTAANAIKLANEELGRDDITMLVMGEERLAKSATIEGGSYKAKTSGKAAKPAPAQVKFTIELDGESIELQLRAGSTVADAIKLANEETGRCDISVLLRDGNRVGRTTQIESGTYTAKVAAGPASTSLAGSAPVAVEPKPAPVVEAPPVVVPQPIAADPIDAAPSAPGELVLIDGTRKTLPEFAGKWTQKASQELFGDPNSVKSVKLPGGVTAICERAFCDGEWTKRSVRFPALESIVIQAGCKSIESYAFTHCSGLKRVVMAGCESIARDAFAGCSSLTEARIPVGCQSIGQSAFKGCSSLATAKVPAGCKSIGTWAFQGCSSLTNADLPDDCESIGECAFKDCSSLVTAKIGASCKSLGRWMFGNCTSLTSVELPAGIQSIGDRVFCNCRSLARIAIPAVCTLHRDACFGCDAVVTRF